ncbi:MAG TPA: hypothetical protein VMG81_07180 [Thermoplasmata archaeon]|nr:hypothetical protein [Thermoplasmata archaeon]
MSPTSNGAFVGYLFVAVFGLLVLRRAYRMTQGTPLRSSTILVMPVFYLLIYSAEIAVFLFAGAGTSLANVAYAFLAADLVLLVVGALLAYAWVGRHVELYRPEGSQRLYYRLNPLLPVVYVVLFFVRVGLAAAFLGETPFAIPSTSSIAGLSFSLFLLLGAIDALWGLSTGFLIGRNISVYHHGQRHEAAQSAPLP